MKLDEIDLKILVELQEDSRITKTRLAKSTPVGQPLSQKLKET